MLWVSLLRSWVWELLIGYYQYMCLHQAFHAERWLFAGRVGLVRVGVTVKGQELGLWQVCLRPDVVCGFLTLCRKDSTTQVQVM